MGYKSRVLTCCTFILNYARNKYTLEQTMDTSFGRWTVRLGKYDRRDRSWTLSVRSRNISDVCFSEEGSPVWKDRSVSTVDASLTDHVWQFRWYFSYLFDFNIWHIMFQKYCFCAVYKLYYFTNLILRTRTFQYGRLRVPFWNQKLKTLFLSFKNNNINQENCKQMNKTHYLCP